MRICPSCGRENADSRDFCDCGEYLRWEPTQHVQALKPAASSPSAASDAPSTPAAAPADRAASDPPTASLDPNVTLAPHAAAVASPPPSRPRGIDGMGSPAAGAPAAAPPGAATLLLRLPDDDGVDAGPTTISVKPGERGIVLGLIRNESGIVDNYDISVSGLPEGWWTVTPATAYLVPYGTSGSYEQEFQVHVHPPRTPQAHAKPWAFEVVATSRAYQTQVAGAPATVRIEPYQELASKVAPDRASGRLKARFVLTVRNRANAPAEVLLNAEDTDGECQFRFAEPSVTIQPGEGVEAPFTVFPPKQIWIGRPQDRPIRATATPAGVDTPVAPLPAIYRQRAWLPWWLSIVAPIAAALIALFILLQPKQTVVPNLKTAANVFDAQKKLTTAGLKLNPQVQTQAVANAKPGAIVDQDPAAGKKVKRGTAVSIVVAVGSGLVAVPNLAHLTPAVAGPTLAQLGLVLGTVAPQPNPNGIIASQYPPAQQKVKAGTPISVFLQPVVAAKAGASTNGSTNGSTTGNSSKQGAGAAKPVSVPSVAGGQGAVVAQQLSQLGLVPLITTQFSSQKQGTVVAVNPSGGSLPVGSKVTVTVSAGYPELIYDDGNVVYLEQNGDPKTAKPLTAGSSDEAAWSPDGNTIVYVQGPANAGQLMLLNLNQQGAQPIPLTNPASDDHDPAFAPSGNVLAFIDRKGGVGQLCFATIGQHTPINEQCTKHPGFDLGRRISWSNDGSSIITFGAETGHPEVHGLIEFQTNNPDRTNAGAWGSGYLITKPQWDAIDGAFSSDGKRVAIAANVAGSGYTLYLAPPLKSFDPAAIAGWVSSWGAQSIGACQVSWRSDGGVLAVMSSTNGCVPNGSGVSPRGFISQFDAANPAQGEISLASNAENPAWQPKSLSLGG
jgi:beta-lactam-binding protein with PASTA domain